MGAEVGNRLTLEGLSQRLQALERENERMRLENVELQDEVNALRDSVTHRGEMVVLRSSDAGSSGVSPSEFEGRVSARQIEASTVGSPSQPAEWFKSWRRVTRRATEGWEVANSGR